MRGIMVFVTRRWTGANPEEACGIALAERCVGKKVGEGDYQLPRPPILLRFQVNWRLSVGGAGFYNNFMKLTKRRDDGMGLAVSVSRCHVGHPNPQPI